MKKFYTVTDTIAKNKDFVYRVGDDHYLYIAGQFISLKCDNTDGWVLGTHRYYLQDFDEPLIYVGYLKEITFDSLKRIFTTFQNLKPEYQAALKAQPHLECQLPSGEWVPFDRNGHWDAQYIRATNPWKEVSCKDNLWMVDEAKLADLLVLNNIDAIIYKQADSWYKWCDNDWYRVQNNYPTFTPACTTSNPGSLVPLIPMYVRLK